MVICWDSFSDGLHHPYPGVRLCVPPGGPAHLHRAAQVCSYDGKLLLSSGQKKRVSCKTKRKSYSLLCAWLIITQSHALLSLGLEMSWHCLCYVACCRLKLSSCFEPRLLALISWNVFNIFGSLTVSDCILQGYMLHVCHLMVDVLMRCVFACVCACVTSHGNIF